MVIFPFLDAHKKLRELYRQGNYIVEDVFKNVFVSVFVLLVCLRVSIQQLSSGPMSRQLLEFNNTYSLIQFYALPRIFILCFH